MKHTQTPIAEMPRRTQYKGCSRANTRKTDLRECQRVPHRSGICRRSYTASRQQALQAHSRGESAGEDSRSPFEAQRRRPSEGYCRTGLASPASASGSRSKWPHPAPVRPTRRSRTTLAANIETARAGCRRSLQGKSHRRSGAHVPSPKTSTRRIKPAPIAQITTGTGPIAGGSFTKLLTGGSFKLLTIKENGKGMKSAAPTIAARIFDWSGRLILRRRFLLGAFEAPFTMASPSLQVTSTLRLTPPQNCTAVVSS
ncbi:hypothetical protein BN77_p10838 [Rhizobium mesoamericanum STM3625]|uniref:Uncharacterized protein n=1 Tax=Rhizobium mesoamericanum STM3625 TaxID=1211777 RepID=K0Q3R7_9HYPH|nr:hypothetical protein BN77_p10838 [Rhizobium mesoamericanum STM3625]